jgi:uncharacterized repeat protein (TIGR03803 family)
MVFASLAAFGQTDFLRLRSFVNQSQSASTPSSPLLNASDGSLYATSTEGGSNDLGTVFSINKDGTGFSILHHFAGGTNDGQVPRSGVIEGSDGALYGSTSSGGRSGLGTIFRVSKDGTSFSLLHHFSAADGSPSQGSLLQGEDSALYGTTASGLFRINIDGSDFHLLHQFSGGTDGQNPQCGLTKASDGLLYGTTYSGGSSNLGTVFRIDEAGANYQVIFSFGATAGRNPTAALVEGGDGFLYGTTSVRLTNSYGTVFKVSKDGAVYSVLHDFSGASLDGWYPQPALVEGTNGSLYGVTLGGGDEGQGTIFAINKDGSSYLILHSFSWDGNDGRIPMAGLCRSDDGMLYGTVSRGGNSDYGAIFKIEQSGARYNQFYSLSWPGADGWNPQCRLVEGNDGRLYGTTSNGGSNDFGTVFAIDKDRTGYSILHHFTWFPDGAFPQAGVIEATNGALYGTTFEGGTNHFGTIFRISKDGAAFATLHHFTGLPGDGGHPQARLVAASDGFIYGTTAQGGSTNWGTVFRISSDGNGFVLVRDIPGTNVAEIEPAAGLLEGKDGLLYGTASGGQSGTGSAFRLEKNGSAFTNLHLFTGSAAEGRGIISELFQPTNGALYGTAFSGGAANVGTVFKLNTDGSGFTVLKSFSLFGTGRNPSAGLIQSSNGTLYGTCVNGSATNTAAGTNWGTSFKIDSTGSNFAVVHDFSTLSGGRNPNSALALASDGSLYGSAPNGGDVGLGAIFSLADPPSFTDLQFSTSGAVLHLRGISSRTYAIQATVSLLPPSWLNLSTPVAQTNGLFEFADPSATNFTSRFYRAQTQP